MAGRRAASATTKESWDYETMSQLYPNSETFAHLLAMLESYVKSHPKSAAANFVLGYQYDMHGKLFLTKKPKLLLNDNNAGKPEGIHLLIGRRPYAAFGNSAGDRQMLEYTQAGNGVRLAMLVLHDDAKREYAYGPAQGLRGTKVGAFTQTLYDE